MIQVPGYRVKEQIYKSKNSTIYRGIMIDGDIPVVMKVLEKEYPSSQELACFRREYEITRSLRGDDIITVYNLEKYENTLVLVLEDFGGDSLDINLPVRRPGLAEKLSLAIRMTGILGHIHQQDIIHKDVNPSNFVWNPETGLVKIIDFGISTELTREDPETRNPNILEGTLNYISPEQTGRMNRAMDYRTDLYSLGVAFYEMFSGRLPFLTDDAMEMVHCHIAKTPERLKEANPEIPAVISAIVMKLLSKTAEERYQNTLGLKRDLEYCLDQLQSKAVIDSFEIGRDDISDRFRVPQKLYGREREIKTVLRVFDRVAAGAKEILLVAGHPGIGKSALVHEVNKPITEKRGNFISGKFDQYKRNIPYSALIHAFGGLIRNVLAESEEKLEAWKKKLTLALEPSAQVIIDVIPEVELIIGKQPPVQELDPEQARNRFNIEFRNFVRVFAREESPLVLFIDDLQWADLPSLKLMEQFMTDIDTGYMLIVGAYRDNEVDSSHPLMMLLEVLKKTGAGIDTITVRPLEPDQVNHLLSDTLLCDTRVSYPLAELCVEKTLGNPFFLNQLLYSLYEESLIDFDAAHGIWKYNVIRIREVDITDNVVELMVGKIRKLSEETQDILKLASCIGNQFDLDTIALVYEKSKNSMARILFEPLKENLIIPMDNFYKFISESHEDLSVSYRFLHDRIQQAAYSLIDDDDKKELHIKIGRLMLETDDKTGDKIFDMVSHLNHGIDIIDEHVERDRLLELNLAAGKKAIHSAAYKPAAEYLKAGITFAGKNGWEKKYTLMLSLHEEAAEAAYLGGDYEESERLFTVVIGKGKTVTDTIKAYETRILTLTSEGRYKEAVECGLKILKSLGVSIPKNPGKGHIAIELIKVKLTWAGKTDEDIIAFPEMKDPIALARGRILHKIAAAAYSSKPELFPINIFKRLHLYRVYGNDPFSSFSTYAAFGLILCSIGDSNGGYRFGKLAVRLLEESPVKKDKSRIFMIQNVFIRHWKEHLRESFAPSLLAYESRLETGDMEYASHAATSYCSYIFFSGEYLKVVEKEQGRFINAITMLQQKLDLDVTTIYHQATVNLLDPCGISTRLYGKSFNEDTMIPVFQTEGSGHCLLVIYVLKLNLAYLAGNYEEAYGHAGNASQYVDSARAMFIIPYLNFYESLAALALCGNEAPKNRKKYLKKVSRNQRKMKKWAFHAPANFLHKWHLVEAEKARVLRSNEHAKVHYKKTIELSRENEFHQEEALGFELYARFLFVTGEEDFAGFTIKRAHYCYSLWGSAAKVFHLEKNYPDLLKDVEEVKGLKRTQTAALPSLSFTTSETESGSTDALDLSTIMKAARTISREIVLANLLVKLMNVSMENAGADAGFMILQEKGKLYVEAEAVTGRDETPILKSVPLEEHQGLAVSIVNYVARTRETLILSNASFEGDFVNDPYIVENRSRSILCSPILSRGELSGILYLENNLSDNTFSPERLELLEILFSQAAISIDNARLLSQRENAARLETEMKIAAQIQTALLPEAPAIPGFDITAYLKPASDVGGDYYDIINSENSNWVIIGDVSGHGVPAGLVMMMVQASIRSYLGSHPETKPSRLLRVVNKAISYNVARMKQEKYMTITALSFNKEGSAVFSGLHLDLIMYRAASDSVEMINSEGIWLSPWKHLPWKDKDLELHMAAGDTLLLYTDGIIEAKNTENDMFTQDRLMNVIKESGVLSTEGIKEAVLSALKGYTADDDMTMVILKKV
ncbi:MAG: AAA family ATPase [bacterium]|nr:AAA family ATPase [bacterium]